MSTININVSKTDMGLDQVDNTSDLNKPISTATQTALNNKVDVVSGSRLITSAEATDIGYLSGVASNVQNQINNKANLNTIITPATATKVTYDAKGMILSGTNITTSDVSGLGTLATQNGTFSGTSSGSNTGDQDLSGYQLTSSKDASSGYVGISAGNVITLPLGRGFISNNVTPNQIAYFDNSGNLLTLSVATYPSISELSYVKGVTSAIQTQINSRASQDARVQTVTSSATVTPVSTNDLVIITAQAAGLTLANPTGTFTEGQALMIRIKDNGTARAIAFDTNYRAIGVTLPTTTVISKTLYLGIIYNATDSKWDVIGYNIQA